MNKILVVTHGDFCKGILSSIEMIMGDHDGIKTLSLECNEGLTDLADAITKEIDAVGKNNVLIFTDLFGATPFNASVMNTKRFADQPVRVISGVNLPMLIEAKSLMDSMEIDDLYDHIIEIGKESISGYKYSKKHEEMK